VASPTLNAMAIAGRVTNIGKRAGMLRIAGRRQFTRAPEVAAA